MGELLPIIFQRGVNEGVDIRVAPTDAHSIAENVRWRKDGRPAKRYGSDPVDTSGFSAAYRSQHANVIASWQGQPVLSIGSSIRSQSTRLGFAIPGGSDRDLPHWGGAKRDVISRSEPTNEDNPTAGLSKGVVLHVWEQGGGPALAYAIKNTAGAVLQPPTLYSAINNAEPRCVSTPNFIYLLYKQGTNLFLDTFDPTTCTFTNSLNVGTLDAAGSHFDACGRTTDFLVSYQSAAGVVTTKLFSAIAAPALLQTIATAVAVTGTRVGVVSDQASQVFVGVLEPSAGQIKVQVFNNGLTASLGAQVLDTDINNDSQPGLVLRSTTTADVVWSGYVAATESSYFRYARLSAGVIIVPARTFFGVGLASKPFVGPAHAAIGDIDATYVWVETSNRSVKWDTQRAYLLVKVNSGSAPPRPQLSLPNVPPSTTTRLHLSDVLDMGVGLGFIVPLPNAIRFGNGLTPNLGIDAVTFRSIFESPRMAARDTVTAGRALQISGGTLFEFLGYPSQTGFSNIPVIQSIAPAGGGGLSAGQYLYRVVYEYIDNQGRRHRSAPSDPFTITSGALGQATLVLKPLVASGHAPIAATIVTTGVVFHVYRSLVNQGTYHRVTPNSGAPIAVVVGTATVSYVDAMNDNLAAAQELLYTDGGVVPNVQPPPGDFLTVVNGRVVVAGQPDRNVVTLSKLLVDGEPTQFSDEAEFSVYLPEDCTGIASIDGTVVAFGRERIYLFGGEGPNDQGIDGSFSAPSELPTDVGCIDWRSVVETSIGVFFQSKRGIYLLPRGFGAPVFVGADIEDTTTDTPVIFSATVASVPFSVSPSSEILLGEITARFVLGDETADTSASCCASYDLRTGGWSIDRRDQAVIDGYVALAGTWGDTFVYSTTTGLPGGGFNSIRAERAGSWDDGPDGANPTFISSSLGTGDIRPFGVAGYGGFDRVVVVGEYRGDATVNVTVWVDGNPAQFTFNITAPDPSTDDGSVYLDVTPPNRLGTAIRVVVQDVPLAATFPPPATEGFLVQAIFIEHDTIGKTKRLAQARKA